MAANRIDAAPPSLKPISAACSNPTASINASISVTRSSIVRTLAMGSDMPTPALSKTSTRANEARWSKKALYSGETHSTSTFVTNDPDTTMFTGPEPNTW